MSDKQVRGFVEILKRSFSTEELEYFCQRIAPSNKGSGKILHRSIDDDPVTESSSKGRGRKRTGKSSSKNKTPLGREGKKKEERTWEPELSTSSKSTSDTSPFKSKEWILSDFDAPERDETTEEGYESWFSLSGTETQSDHGACLKTLFSHYSEMRTVSICLAFWRKMGNRPSSSATMDFSPGSRKKDGPWQDDYSALGFLGDLRPLTRPGLIPKALLRSGFKTRLRRDEQFTVQLSELLTACVLAEEADCLNFILRTFDVHLTDPRKWENSNFQNRFNNDYPIDTHFAEEVSNHQSVSTLKVLLDNNYPPDGEQSDHPYGPLYYCLKEDRLQAVKLLIQRGAKVKHYGGGEGGYTNYNGESYFHLCESNESKIILLEGGADPEDRGRNDINSWFDLGETVLFHADLSLTKLLVEKYNANVNVQNNVGQTPLHVAKSLPVVKLLVQSGASIDTKDAEGNTPLAPHQHRLRKASGEDDEDEIKAVVDFLVSQGAQHVTDDEARYVDPVAAVRKRRREYNDMMSSMF